MKKGYLFLLVVLSSCKNDTMLLQGGIIEYYIQFNKEYSSSINVIAHLEIINPYEDSILLYITDNYSEEHPVCRYSLIFESDTLSIKSDQYYNVETYILPNDTFRFYMKILEYDAYQYSFRDIIIENSDYLKNCKIVYNPNLNYVNYNYVNPIVIYRPIKKIKTIFEYNNIQIDSNSVIMNEKLQVPVFSDSLFVLD